MTTTNITTASDTSDTTTAAVELLKESSLFHDAADGLLQALATKMTRVSAPDGHIFAYEREPIRTIILLERGVLKRTKQSYSDDTSQSAALSMQALRDASVVVDTIRGRGRITGVWHNFKAGSLAYATVSAAGPVTVWMMEGQDFRQAISSAPDYALQVMFAMSRELRQGSKSLRSLIAKLRENSDETDADPDHEHHLEVTRKNNNVCKVLCYDATSWVREGFTPAIKDFNTQQLQTKSTNAYRIVMDYTTERLGEQTATFAAGYDAVCLFVNDTANASVVQTLSLLNVKLAVLRCAGFDRVDTHAARAFGLAVARVPAYSPHAVAEMAVALLMERVVESKWPISLWMRDC
jgi:hypothetical protein